MTDGRGESAGGQRSDVLFHGRPVTERFEGVDQRGEVAVVVLRGGIRRGAVGGAASSGTAGHVVGVSLLETHRGGVTPLGVVSYPDVPRTRMLRKTTHRDSEKVLTIVHRDDKDLDKGCFVKHSLYYRNNYSSASNTESQQMRLEPLQGIILLFTLEKNQDLSSQLRHGLIPLIIFSRTTQNGSTRISQ